MKFAVFLIAWGCSALAGRCFASSWARRGGKWAFCWAPALLILFWVCCVGGGTNMYAAQKLEFERNLVRSERRKYVKEAT